MIKRKQDTVLKVADGGQLMDFLMAKMGGMARSSVKQLLGQRRVKVGNAVQTRHDFMLKAGDVVTVSSGRGNSQLTHPKLRIVYEDDDLIVVNKQPGLLTVAATPGSSETTAYSILRAYVKKQNARAGIYVVHRLDRETSGLLVFARSEELQHYMRQYWRELVTERTYIALAEGVLEPREGKITTWLTEDKRNAVVYSSPVDDGGDIAITNYKVQRTSADGQYSLVELHLETGRTNQIRVHLASKGCPVVGDRKYGHGNESSPIDRLCLHAKVLAFIHPVTEKTVACSLGSSVTDLQCVRAAEFLFDIGDDTHLGIFIGLNRNSHQALVALLHRRTLVDDILANLFRLSESVIQLDTRLCTVLFAELCGRGTYIDIAHEGFLLQLGELGSLRVLELNLIANLLHRRNGHEEEEQHEDNIRERRRIERRHLTFLISTNLCHVSYRNF